tara:strand:- start:1171 stop:1431 length:261 start_codon:yes stop_codon:yes gene_type:complete
MSDNALSLILALLTAAVTYFATRPKRSSPDREAANRKADSVAEVETSAAKAEHDQEVDAAASRTQAIDRASIDTLSSMVNHEYGSD